MKTLTFILVSVFIALMFYGCNDATITPSESVQAEDNFVPFKGSLEGIAVTSGNGYPVPKQISASGNATHTGKIDAVVDYFITYNGNPPTGGLIPSGTAVITAANGDKIFLSGIAGLWYFTSPTDVYFSFDANVSGGTGRFANATGQLSGEGTQLFDPYSDPTPTFYAWTGSINY